MSIVRCAETINQKTGKKDRCYFGVKLEENGQKHKSRNRYNFQCTKCKQWSKGFTHERCTKCDAWIRTNWPKKQHRCGNEQGEALQTVPASPTASELSTTNAHIMPQFQLQTTHFLCTSDPLSQDKEHPSSELSSISDVGSVGALISDGDKVAPGDRENNGIIAIPPPPRQQRVYGFRATSECSTANAHLMSLVQESPVSPMVPPPSSAPSTWSLPPEVQHLSISHVSSSTDPSTDSPLPDDQQDFAVSTTDEACVTQADIVPPGDADEDRALVMSPPEQERPWLVRDRFYWKDMAVRLKLRLFLNERTKASLLSSLRPFHDYLRVELPGHDWIKQYFYHAPLQETVADEENLLTLKFLPFNPKEIFFLNVSELGAEKITGKAHFVLTDDQNHASIIKQLQTKLSITCYRHLEEEDCGAYRSSVKKVTDTFDRYGRSPSSTSPSDLCAPVSKKRRL